MEITFSAGEGTIEDPFIIEDVHDLQNMAGDLHAHYALGNDIDASETSEWNWNGTVYYGFIPVGNDTHLFYGSLDGRNYTVTGLYIKRDIHYSGLFGYAQGATIKNIGLEDVIIDGGPVTGGLAGWVRDGTTISNSYSSGEIQGRGSTGGLVGRNIDSLITDCYSMGSVSGGQVVGGLADASPFFRRA